MLKDIKTLSDLIKINTQKEFFDKDVLDVLKTIKEESGVCLKEDCVFIKKHIIKIKTSSNIKFVIFLHLKNINNKIKNLNQNLILEL